MMPEGPGDICLRCRMIMVVMGGKEGSIDVGLGKWMKRIGVGCDVVCDEFNVLLVKIFVIRIVSEDF